MVRKIWLLFLVFNVAECDKSNMKHLLKLLCEEYTPNSIILAYNNKSLFDVYGAELYGLYLPCYNIYLEELYKFNGKHQRSYEISVTYEENKIYFLLCNTVQEVRDYLPFVRDIYFWRDRDKMVVITDKMASHEQIQQVFLYCFEFHIINIVFMFVDATSRTQSFTYNPYTSNFSVVVEQSQEFFPDKLKDLHGHKLRISLFPSVINWLEDGKYQGRDGFMSRTIAKHINSEDVYIDPPADTDQAPILTQFQDVRKRTVDVAFSTRYIKFNFKNYVEKTYPHDRDDLACLVPTIGSGKVGEIKGLTSLLPGFVWFLTFALSLFLFFYIFQKRNLQHWKHDHIDTVLAILLLILNKPIREDHARFIPTVIFFYVVFLNTLLISRLTSIITAPARQRQINTVKELTNTDYKIKTIDRFEELLNASLSTNVKGKLSSRFDIINEPDFLQEMSKCDPHVAFICKDHLANYAIIQKDNYPHGDEGRFYRIMKEKIFPSLSCYIVWYGSPFMPKFNQLIGRIVESGIDNYWKIATWRKLAAYGYDQYNRANFRQAKKLSMSYLILSLGTLFVGLISALLAFIWEILHQKWKMRRNR